MKFTVEKTPFGKALSHITRIVERRNTYPILGNVLIEANDGAVRLTATDLDIEVRELVAAVIVNPGKTTVPANMLSDIVRKLPDGAEIGMELGEGDITIKAGRSRFKLATLSPESFPDLKVKDTPHVFTMPGANLERIINSIGFAISNEETRYYLNGIYLHVADGKLRGVATDGHRMARRDVELPDGAGDIPGIIVPRKTVAELGKLLDGAGEIRVRVGETRIVTEIGGLVLTSKLIEGTFPDYNRVTPAIGNRIAELGIKDCRSVIDRVSTVATDRGGKAVKLTLENGTMSVAVDNPDHGRSEEDMVAGWQDEKFEIGFNARYLNDVLGTLSGSQVKISLTDAGAPARLWSDEDPSAVFVLMPMRV